MPRGSLRRTSARTCRGPSLLRDLAATIQLAIGWWSTAPRRRAMSASIFEPPELNVYDKVHKLRDAADAFFKQGFVIVDVPDLPLQDLMTWCKSCTIDSSWQHRGEGAGAADRYTMNKTLNICDPVWLKTGLILEHRVGCVFQDIAERASRGTDDRWWFDKAGGDVVMPGCGPMPWHSDWPGRRCDSVAMIACSIYLEHQDPRQAPMMAIPADKTVFFFAGTAESSWTPLQSELDSAVRLCPKAGQVLIRNVVAWHGGTANDTLRERHLPCMRVCLAAAWDDGTWKGPTRALPADYQKRHQLSKRWSGVLTKLYPNAAAGDSSGQSESSCG